MKCFKCDQGELEVIEKNGKKYAQCKKCGSLFTADDIRNLSPRSPIPQTTHMEVRTEEDEEYDDHSLGKIATISGWILCALFLMFGSACGGLSIVPFLAGAVLVSPIFRNRVYLSGKIWIPLVMVLFCVGAVLTPQTDTEPKKITDKQETATSTKKQAKISAKKQDKKDTKKEKSEKEEAERAAQEQAERNEQERIAQEQAEQERIAQEQAAAQAEQERIAQEQAAAQAEQERIAQEQAAAQAEQERIAQEQAEQQRIAQEQAAAAQAEQERIAQEQASQTNVAQNPFDIYDDPEQQQTSSAYVLNMNTNKFHYPQCNDVRRIAPHNYATSDGTREDIIDQGYSPCGHCDP